MTGLVRQLSQFVRGPNRLAPERYAASKPLRNPTAVESTDAEGNLVLTFSVEHDQRLITRIFDRLARSRETREFLLESIGATVWRACDGKTTVKTIAKRLCTEYKMNKLEAETALAQYLQTLSQRGLITMLVVGKK